MTAYIYNIFICRHSRNDDQHPAMANRQPPFDTEHHRGTTSTTSDKQSRATNVQSRIRNTSAIATSHHHEKCRGKARGKFRRSLQTIQNFIWDFSGVYDIYGTISMQYILLQHKKCLYCAQEKCFNYMFKMTTDIPYMAVNC